MSLTKITSKVLADEFTVSSEISSSAVDWEEGAVFTKECTGNTTLTFSNVKTGMVKTLCVYGNHTITWPAGVKWLNGIYSGTATKNIIQLISTNDDTEIFGTISNYTE